MTWPSPKCSRAPPPRSIAASAAPATAGGAALVKGDRDLADGASLRAEFGSSVDDRAAAKILAGKAPLQRVEGCKNLFSRRLDRCPGLAEPARQISRYQRIL